MSAGTQPSDESASDIKDRHREVASEVVPDESARHYIGGEWVESDSGDTFQTRDPTTNEVLAELQAGNEADIDAAVAAAWDAYDDHWSDTSASERQQVLQRISDRLEERKEDFAKIEALDNGKPLTEARIDMDLAIEYFRYFGAACRVEEGTTVPVSGDNHVETIREPYGVVGGITPWNFPLFMATLKIAPALAAGNAVVLKPAEQTSLSVLELMREVDDILPDGVVNVVTGFGPEAGEPLSLHEDVPKLAFTGSTGVGKQLMKNAAENVSDISLELGGKSPVIVFPDADIDAAAQVAKLGMFFNTGECCSAGSRLFVHEDIREEFEEAFVSEIQSLEIGDPLRESTTLGPKVSPDQASRTLDYISQAQQSGATISTGGGPPDDDALSEGSFVEPTVITDIDHDDPVVQEEIFGPVETLFEWTNYDEMIERANDVDYGLAAGILTSNIDQAYSTARDLEAGNVWVNTYNEFPPGQPWGGYKQSGIGRENAAETLKNYTQTKAINIGL